MKTDTKTILGTEAGELVLRDYTTKSTNRKGFKVRGVLTINGVRYQMCNAILSPQKGQEGIEA